MSTQRSVKHLEFNDEDPTHHYDRMIQSFRESMPARHPCDLGPDVDRLVIGLRRERSTFYPRPCVEGYCLGMAIPHQSRIDRRIESFVAERAILAVDCASRRVDDQERARLALAQERNAEYIKAVKKSQKTVTSVHHGPTDVPPPWQNER
eukprot:TRINITY_DN9607_c0_g1_i1.p2 TRINITY_DN9607_c0_g1~~TRINITY_DN9607_c0_g1_i1.p2  ORF type:complete len:150 (+),score=18.72 TRINITY_DN9607_c0_g1_i1:138-587(+)